MDGRLKFTYIIDGEGHGESTEITIFIIVLLAMSWGIIFTCRYLELKGEASTKMKAIAANAPKYKS